MLTSSQITLPPTHEAVMELEGIKRDLKKWRGYAAGGRTRGFRSEAANVVKRLEARQASAEARIRQIQQHEAVNPVSQVNPVTSTKGGSS